MEANIAIKGGLGNQLFQYAYGCFINKKYNCKVYFDAFPLDVKETNLTNRILLLDQLFSNIKFTDKKTHKLYYSQKDPFLVKVYKKFNRLINRQIFLSETKELNLISGRKYYLDGYWQDISYAKLIREETNKALYKLANNEPFFELIKNSNENAAIHIRRGDYINNPTINEFHGNCDLSYYLRAIEQLEKFKSIKAYFIFTDDLEWVKLNLKLNKPTYFFNGNIHNPIVDLFLMKSCNNLIMSNSSLSCWASYLNENESKIVFAPVNWTKKSKTVELQIFDKEWILI